jgi:23S rRNA (guanosine2251-2'-O)-methyltransferase
MNVQEFLFGVHPVKIALEQGRRAIKQLFYYNSNRSLSPSTREILELAERKGINTRLVSKYDLYRFTNNETHQNVALRTEPISLKPFSLQSPLTKNFYVGIEEITDPRNLGSIIRTCAFFNIPIIIDSSSGTLSPLVSKTSAGALELYYGQNQILQTKNFSSLSNLELIASLPKNGNNHMKKLEMIERDKVYILLVGNEGDGLKRTTITASKWFVNIPGHFDSLNVSVATGILLHDILKRVN